MRHINNTLSQDVSKVMACFVSFPERGSNAVRNEAIPRANPYTGVWYVLERRVHPKPVEGKPSPASHKSVDTRFYQTTTLKKDIEEHRQQGWEPVSELFVLKPAQERFITRVLGSGYGKRKKARGLSSKTRILDALARKYSLPLYTDFMPIIGVPSEDVIPMRYTPSHTSG
jgi:hypothetical protein